MARVDLKKLNELVAQGYISVKSHPEGFDLNIWNYTPKTQFERNWTDETMMCRGLITDTDGKIIARPFRKFKNLEEIDGPLPDEPFEVTMKQDGSLAILYWAFGVPYIATRGSFDSEQARHATKLYRERYYGLHDAHPEYTYLFEVIYPQNRIVVDYGEMDDLVLIGVIHTETGQEVPLRVMHDQPFPVTRVYDGITDFAELRANHVDNEEGYVIRFEPSNFRVKLKHAEYVRLHRILTNVNERTIWECLMAGDGLEALLDRVPDEFYDWVKRTRLNLQMQFDATEAMADMVYQEAQKLPTRKEQAIYIQSRPCPKSVVFAMLDGKEYRKDIWKMLKPAANKPFKVDADA